MKHLVSVMNIVTGHQETMTRNNFFSSFGSDFGREILRGRLPDIIAAEIDTNDNTPDFQQSPLRQG